MDTFSEYESFDGLGLAGLVQRGVISPKELLQAAIERIETRNPQLNAVIHKMYDMASRAIEQGLPSGVFTGVPFLLKDLLAEYAGAPMSSGSRMLAHYVSTFDTELVKRFKQSGLVILGKTNTPEFGLSPTTEPVLFGPTRNPWDMSRSSGGSSGGSAVAVASGMVPMAHGGDGAGSLRIPASYCGVFGFKPSRGRTPTGPKFMRLLQGMVTEHVITRSVRDSAAMLDVLSGEEMGSAIALPRPGASFLSCLDQKPSRLRIVVVETPFFSGQLDTAYREALDKAEKLCRALGHDVERASFHASGQEVALAFLTVIAAETAATIDDLADHPKRKGSSYAIELMSAMLYEVGQHRSAKDYAWASRTLDAEMRRMAEYFTNIDVVLTPTTPGPPPLIGALKQNPLEKTLMQVLLKFPYGPLLTSMAVKHAKDYFALTPYTPLYNITGQPAMSVPLYQDQNGLPIGMQFAARYREDAVLLQLAAQLEEASPWAGRFMWG